MPEVKGIEKLFSHTASKRLGKHRAYGRAGFAFSEFGEDDIYLVVRPFAAAKLGTAKFGDHLVLSGIYQRNNFTGKVKWYRHAYYITENPRTVPQQANRQKLADAVLAWQGLTTEQKNQYNNSAIGKRMSGYNLYLKEQLLS